MVFELKQLNEKYLNLIYEIAAKDGLLSELRSRSVMESYLGKFKMAVDDARQTLMFPHRVDREDARDRYVLIFGGGIVVFFEEDFCLYSVEKISSHLLKSKDVIENLIREVFAAFGSHIDVDSDLNPVPSATFSWKIGGGV